MPRKTLITLRRGLAADWTSEDPTLAEGEPGFETDTGQFKIGDGSTAWTSLPYAGGGSMALDDLADVNAPAPADQDVLSWDDGAGEWVAVAPGAASHPNLAAHDALGLATDAELATHAGTANAHHDPVTVGTGLDVTGQLVELDLSEVAAGGELGGTMDAPTVDATHSGSTHAGAAAAETADIRAVDVLVGTATSAFSGEIVVGTSPGGELGGTWASPTVDATHAGSTHIALSTSEPGSVSTTSSGTAGTGTAASKDDHSHDLGFDDATADPAAVSTSGADGTATSAARKDHVHAHETAHLAHDTLWDAAGDLVVGTGADTAGKLSISVPAANILNVLGVVNGETTWSVKSVHDGTSPAALGTAAAGTSLFSAHRDHVHPTTGLVTTTAEVTGGGGDVTISDTYADLLSTTITGLVADNQIFVECDALLLNNSGGARTYTVALDLDGVLVEVSDGATIAASATNHSEFEFQGNCDIRATNLAYLSARSVRYGPSAANTATTMAGLSSIRGAWNSTTNDLTGSTIVKVKMKSSVITATQTARVLGWRVRVI